MNKNFTMSQTWYNSIFIRYDLNNLISTSNLCFYNDNKTLICQHFFNFEFDSKDITYLKKMLKEGFKLRFNYIDQDMYEKIVKSFKSECIEIIDKWEAPILQTSNIHEYLLGSKHSQVRRNYNRYLKHYNNYDFILGNEQNIIKLWADVLKIDFNSWKGKNRCDMKSLNREDLQYIFYLLREKNNSSLLVCYENNVPLAYSLMFKSEQNDMWYAVKWGASFEGKKDYLGIYSLVRHLIFLQQNCKTLNVDFWGRRSQAYDYLKNNEIERYHILIKCGDISENNRG